MSTPSEPLLFSWRRPHGLRERSDPDELARPGRALAAGWSDVERAVAHLVLGYRATCGLAAPYWARRRVAEVLGSCTDDCLDALADRLIADADLVADRLGGAE